MKVITKKQLLTALILGHGGVLWNEETRNAESLYMYEEEKDYFRWKYKHFMTFLPKPRTKIENVDGSSCVIYTHDKYCRHYGNFLFRKRQKKLFKFLLRMNHPLCLSIVFMDMAIIQEEKDGLFLYLDTAPFDFSEHQQAVKWFRVKRNWEAEIVEVGVKEDGKKIFNLRFSPSSIESIWGAIEKNVSQVPSQLKRWQPVVSFVHSQRVTSSTG